MPEPQAFGWNRWYTVGVKKKLPYRCRSTAVARHAVGEKNGTRTVTARRTVLLCNRLLFISCGFFRIYLRTNGCSDFINFQILIYLVAHLCGIQKRYYSLELVKSVWSEETAATVSGLCKDGWQGVPWNSISCAARGPYWFASCKFASPKLFLRTSLYLSRATKCVKFSRIYKFLYTVLFVYWYESKRNHSSGIGVSWTFKEFNLAVFSQYCLVTAVSLFRTFVKHPSRQ